MASWIWTGGEAAPGNRFTWFRKVVHLDAMSDAAWFRCLEGSAESMGPGHWRATGPGSYLLAQR